MDTIKPRIIKLTSMKHLQKISRQYEQEGYLFRDIFRSQAEELVDLSLVRLSVRSSKNYSIPLKQYEENNFGSIVIYPWRKSILRILSEVDFFHLLTSRNRYLINIDEQDRYKKTILAVAGLSVGSNIVLAVVMQGGCKTIKIADNDEISTSNMNRIIADLFSVGENKSINIARKLYEINPYIDIKIFSEGVDKSNIDDFLDKADIIFDEVDNLNIKLDLRVVAKSKKIPLVMITDNGDNVIIDIERYDLDPSLLPFHGLLSQEDVNLIRKNRAKLSPQERVNLSLKIVQPQNAVERMQDSLLEVGKTLKTWPQLATASFLAGSVGSYITRKITTRGALNTGRLHVSIDSILIPGYNLREAVKKRDEHTKNFLNNLK